MYQLLPLALKVKQVPSEEGTKRLFVLQGKLSSSQHPLEVGGQARSPVPLPRACCVPGHGSALPGWGQLWRGPPCLEGFVEGGQVSFPCLFPSLWGNRFGGTSEERLHRTPMACAERGEDANPLFCFASLSKIHIVLEFR